MPDGKRRQGARELVSGAAPLPSGLARLLSGAPSLLIAFSGGLDSRFLCHAARLAGRRVTAIHIEGPHVPARESRAAAEWAEKNGVSFISARLDPLKEAGIRQNGRDRCYHCKKAAFGLIKELAGRAGSGLLCDGGNLDDEAEWRPGRRAVRELGFASPLSAAGLGKREIRRWAALSGLDNPEQRARPCLLTRFAYGLAPDLASLARLEKAEAAIEAVLASRGASGLDFRLRLLPEPVLQINPLPDEAFLEVRKALENSGFAGAGVDFMEKISGYYDRAAPAGPQGAL